MGRSLIGSVAVVLLLAISPASAGLVVLDQQQTEGMGNSWTVSSPDKYAQTFTAGLSGSLDHIEVYVAYPLPDIVNVSITDVSGGYPEFPPLGTGSIPKDATDWTSVDFLSQGITISAGTMYAIVLTPTTSGRFAPKQDSLYVDGQALKYLATAGIWGPLFTDREYDFAFKTYVETSPVPLPGAAVLGVLGLGFSGGLLRRRRPTA